MSWFVYRRMRDNLAVEEVLRMTASRVYCEVEWGNPEIKRESWVDKRKVVALFETKEEAVAAVDRACAAFDKDIAHAILRVRGAEAMLNELKQAKLDRISSKGMKVKS